MKGKSLVVACMIVPLAAVSLVLYLYGNQGKINIDRYGFLRVHDSELVVQFDQHLIWLDEGGREQKAVDLQQLAINPHGDFAFFSDGDLLVYHLEQSLDPLEKLAQYLRLKKSHSRASLGDNGLYRCILSQLSCNRFGGEVPLLNRAFRVAIDHSTDTVYLADTSAFKLYKLDNGGAITATSDTQTTRFPNQLAVHEGRLWLADTNNHRLVSIDTSDAHYGRVEEALNMNLDGVNRWPHQIAKSPTGWWVNVADNRMANGRVVHLGANGQVDRELSLSASDEPMAIAYWHDALWIADFTQPKLTRYDSDGTPLAGVDSPTLEVLTTQSIAAYQHYQRLGLLGVVGFVSLLMAGFAAAWTLERQQTIKQLRSWTASDINDAIMRPAKPVSDGEIYWLSNELHRKKPRIVALASMSIALLIIGAASVAHSARDLTFEANAFLFSAVFLMAILTLAFTNALLRISQLKLGVTGEALVLERAGKRVIAQGSEILYTTTTLATKDITIALGGPQQRFFDKQELHDYVFPRLKDAQELSRWAMLERLWRQRDPQLMTSIVVGAIIAPFYILIVIW